MRILVVEDDPLTQDIVASILGSRGLKADRANDGFAAVRMLNDRPYDVALIDYHLPEMDGYALAKLMRNAQNGLRSRLTLIGITADRNGLAARPDSESIFDAILAKPFDPLELIGRLERPAIRSTEQNEVSAAAAFFLAKPNLDRALDAATSFWRSRGLARCPKAAVVPAPTAEQAGAIQICFDIVDQNSAELLLLLDAKGLQQLILLRQQGAIASFLPVIALEPTLAVFSDAYFDISDPASWSVVAAILKGGRAAAAGQ